MIDLNKINLDHILKSARLNGLIINENKSPGLYLGSNKISVDELFDDFLEDIEFDDFIAKSSSSSLRLSIDEDILLDKKESNIVFKKIVNQFAIDSDGAA